MYLCALLGSPLAYISALLLAWLIPEWPLRDWIDIAVVYLTVPHHPPAGAG